MKRLRGGTDSVTLNMAENSSGNGFLICRCALSSSGCKQWRLTEVWLSNSGLPEVKYRHKIEGSIFHMEGLYGNFGKAIQLWYT